MGHLTRLSQASLLTLLLLQGACSTGEVEQTEVLLRSGNETPEVVNETPGQPLPPAPEEEDPEEEEPVEEEPVPPGPVIPPPPPPPPPTTADCKKPFDHLEQCNWPGPTNTGYPAGTTFTSANAKVVTVDNTVIDGAKVTGGLFIRAKNVIVRNSWISRTVGKGTKANASGVIQIDPGASVTIERTTLDGLNGTHACIWHEGDKVVAQGINCLGVNDGFFVWDADNFTLKDSYFHDLTEETANGHVDGFQTEGGSHGLIQHNVFDIPQDQNAAIAIWNSLKTSDDIRVDNNLIAGSGFAVYVHDYSPSEANPAGGFSVTNIHLTNNQFSNIYYPCVGNWGVWFPRGNPTDKWNRSGNVLLETGESLDNSNPRVNGRVCN